MTTSKINQREINMTIQIASPDQISKLLAFIGVKAKGTQFEVAASLLQSVENELHDFCKARRITVQFEDPSTDRIIYFCTTGVVTGTVMGAILGGVLGALTGAVLGTAAGAALAQIRITVTPVADSGNLVLTLV
ncbi:hypothetical protein L5M18_14555 [Shewanella sp. SM20]|uniref:hypothetical protein n=1 Tax=Shewanella TaxID=22 RepID=UPI0021D9AE61|nr:MULTISPECIES: hypothetical protein [unclassified Shewanella]MCU8070418.1 hypothetical protein [Shewanella sp. SM32]MCU8092779.1 hypothetical protein [Shewanella sp. SM20]